ncbi:uncharacterized protein LOC113321521 [Papaver somniferum]|uniref:uncharacterized protein LOC113321521 n=1 Tax=Papaver somniferum TaxID=3469 RepID=UPI000E6F67B6|nr:uncharacterized protein LOC113321521 [Papaver somniferum]
MYGFSISNLELSKRFFSSCPVLETLNTIGSDVQTDNHRNFTVDSLSLEKFSYTRSHKHLLPENDNVTNIIKLCAPNLEDFFCSFFLTPDYSLEISSPLSGVSFQVRLNAQKQDESAETYENLPSKEKAVYAKRMLKYLGAVSMVRDMGLSPGFLEVLSQAPDLLSCQQLHLYNLQDLSLLMWLTRGSLRALAYLLSISPNITRLFLESKQSTLTGVGDDWETGLSLPGMLSHLKYVEMEEAEGCDAELKLLSFLLRNAKVLEKVVNFFRSTVDLPDKSRVRQVEQFKDKLRAVPTASLSIKMLFY